MIQKYIRQILLEREGKWPPTMTLNGNMSLMADENQTMAYTVVTEETVTLYSNGTAANTSAAEVMVEDDINPNMIDLLWSITVAVCVLFGMFGAFLSGKIAEKIGRLV